jgi:hypothetical protein
MAAINYTGIVDILPPMFGADEKTLRVEAVREHVTLSFDDERKNHVEINMEITSLLIEISIDIDLFRNINRDKWISKFEYECEQWYKTNIKIRTKEQGCRFIITVNF